MRADPPVLKRLGQHFISDLRILSRIADAADLSSNDTAVEIGAGRGALTAVLAERAGRVIAIEVDKMLVARLLERFANSTNVQIVQGDAQSFTFGHLAAVDARPGGGFKLVGNLPYYITTPLLFQALTPPRPELALFLIQKEVAERAAAPPGSRVYGALSVNLQALTQVEMVFEVAASAFSPPPSVDSALLRLRPGSRPLITADQEKPFRELVQNCFALRRKQLRRIVRTVRELSVEDAARVVERAGLDPESRPETLSPADFARLLEAMP
jgi:16S rRNA (adenine1518-N6/adenine1519-N6)-dimethyltransferase